MLSDTVHDKFAVRIILLHTIDLPHVGQQRKRLLDRARGELVCFRKLAELVRRILCRFSLCTITRYTMGQSLCTEGLSATAIRLAGALRAVGPSSAAL